VEVEPEHDGSWGQGASQTRPSLPFAGVQGHRRDTTNDETYKTLMISAVNLERCPWDHLSK